MTLTVVETVPAALDGERIDRAVAILVDRSRAAVSRLIDTGAVRVGGDVISAGSRRVIEGEEIAVELPPDVPREPQPDPDVAVRVIHDDDSVIVVDKPAGLVIHPGAGHESGTLVHGLLARFPEVARVGEPHRPGIVHRLDRGTSGLLMVARTTEAYEALVGQLAAREVERVYDALVWGHPEHDAGMIDAPIGRSVRHPTRMTVTERGRPALTHYTVEDRFAEPAESARLELRLETGRTHQIRVHLRAIGHPVVGDRDYDGGRPGIDPGRPFLHAGRLSFRHPTSGEEVSFTSALPPDLADILGRCR